MPRIEINRSGEMEVFVQVVERGGFSAAARALDLTPSAVSKLIARLEARLAVQLVRRSTRQLQLTDEGRHFYDRSVRVLAIAKGEKIPFDFAIITSLIKPGETLAKPVTADVSTQKPLVLGADLLVPQGANFFINGTRYVQGGSIAPAQMAHIARHKPFLRKQFRQG